MMQGYLYMFGLDSCPPQGSYKSAASSIQGSTCCSLILYTTCWSPFGYLSNETIVIISSGLILTSLLS